MCEVEKIESLWAINEFVYVFHQYYKDRSDGSMDCRWFAAFYLLMRLGFYVLFAMTISGFFYSLAVVFTIVCVVVVIVVQRTLQERVRQLQYPGHSHGVSIGTLSG